MLKNCKGSNWCIFLGGAVASLVAAKVVKSKTMRKITVKAVAKGMQLAECAEHSLASIKEEAEDIYQEAKQAKCGCEDSKS